ncbi:Remorin [Heracleum sosnowskyi]|uniref:Remorin n=1 Tax=Heracleum sosnowskyi TaxID=360622 RepID=A0AAD8J015_9APIA|nr:Remorin [Heracleum sosnowskyi]
METQPAEPQPHKSSAEPPPASYGAASNDVVGQENSDLSVKKSSKEYDERENTVPTDNKSHRGSYDRDVALSDLDKEKTLSFINAWEHNQKAKVENKSQKKLANVNSWENNQKAKLEAKLKRVEQALENKKAEYAEKMRNKAASVHKEAEEKRAMIEAKRGEDILKTEEMAAKHRATGHVPKKSYGCFGSYT